MKQINILKGILMALIVAFNLTIVSQMSYAQTNKKHEKQLNKERNKMYKEKLKELTKAGYTLSGSARTLKVALLEHYKKLAENGQNQEFVGEVSKCNSINVCRQFAVNNAQNLYAMLANGNVKGRITSLLRGNPNMTEIEIDEFIAAYENSVKAELGGVLTESFSIVKNTGTDKEYKTFFILNEEKAGQARRKAMERSLIETKITIREAEEISKFVNEGFIFD